MKKTEINIEKGVQMSQRERNHGYRTSMFLKMEIGDSFEFEAKTVASMFASALRFAQKQSPKWKFASHQTAPIDKETGNRKFRIWRTQ